MATRRIRRRHRLLSAYVRVELEDRGVSFDDPPARPDEEPTRLRPEPAEPGAGNRDDAREERPA
jgi:hypothetical protein